METHIYITKCLIIATVIILTLWDVYILAYVGQQASISHVIGEASQKFPIIPLAAGFLAGHFWFNRF